jgi:putative transcriptional regulator
MEHDAAAEVNLEDLDGDDAQARNACPVTSLARIRASIYRTPDRVNPAEVRERLHLTQEQFALVFGLDTPTLRNWKQGLSEHDRASRKLLAMIATDPGAAVGLLDV